MVLDALIKIKNEMDSTLTFRRSCREGQKNQAELKKIINFVTQSLCIIFYFLVFLTFDCLKCNVSFSFFLFQCRYLWVMCNEHQWREHTCLSK